MPLIKKIFFEKNFLEEVKDVDNAKSYSIFNCFKGRFKFLHIDIGILY